MSRLSFGSRIHKREGSPDREEIFLIFDGIEFNNNRDENSHKHLNVYAHGEKVVLSISDHIIRESFPDLTINELTSCVFSATFESSISYELNHISIGSSCQLYKTQKNGLCLSISVDFDPINWNNPWSLNDVIILLRELEVSSSHSSIYEEAVNDDSASYRVLVEFPMQDVDCILLDELDAKNQTACNLIISIEDGLKNRINEFSVVSQFDFPSGIRSVCEEYLISFIQFLKDVGVEATADLTHEGKAGQVLFSVTPAGGKDSLEKIRQALDLYLKLAGAAHFDYEPNASIQVDRLESRILFFQSQIKSAHAEAKSQLAEIQSQRTTIEAQKAIILAERVMAGDISASNVFLQTRIEALEKERSDKDQLEFFGGLITFSNPEAFGFSVNLAMVIAALKPIMAEETPQKPSDLPALPPISRGM